MVPGLGAQGHFLADCRFNNGVMCFNGERVVDEGLQRLEADVGLDALNLFKDCSDTTL
jgi:hypothetical protein